DGRARDGDEIVHHPADRGESPFERREAFHPRVADDLTADATGWLGRARPGRRPDGIRLRAPWR
ncbi:MAG TPA: hypothetical protein VFY18_09205, partial [Candidatus Limnocylindrales bacterium]|nr:hypothetical protein [Candidatus Limnocylindrales bacterium]